MGPPAMVRRVCQSVLLSGSFLGMDLLGFSKFWHDVRNPCKIVCDSWIFLKKKKRWMLQKWGKWAKQGFLNLLENLVIFFLNSVSNKSLYYLLYFQSPYFGKIWVLRYRPKCSMSIRLQDFKSTLSLEQNDEVVWFFACWYKFLEIKSWLKNIAVGMAKN